MRKLEKAIVVIKLTVVLVQNVVEITKDHIKDSFKHSELE